MWNGNGFSPSSDRLPVTDSEIANTIPPIVFHRPGLQLKVFRLLSDGAWRRGERDA